MWYCFRFDFSGMFGGKISKPVKFPELLDVRPFMSVTQVSEGSIKKIVKNLACYYLITTFRPV